MWLDGIKLFCFAASYAAGFACEAAGFVFSARLRRILALCFISAGLVAHTLFLAHRTLNDRICPLTTAYDSLLMLAWFLALASLWITWQFPRLTVGLFALPLIIILVISAGLLGDDGRRELHGWARIWGPVHGAMLAVGAGAVFVGFVAGVMYLVQVKRLKAKHLASDLVQLPSLELLERVNRLGITVAFPLLTVGMATGLLLVLEQRRAGIEGIRLSDPKVIFGLTAWLAFGVLLKLQSQPRFRGRKVALLTIVGFCLLLFTMIGVDLLLSSWHQATVGGAS